jgi:DeoR/GlpR family transcriptional regulator of sugar metabolism
MFCFNDVVAQGAIRALADHGLRVPHDVAVVGWDDTEEAGYATPSLTSVSPDKAAIAEAAVALVHDGMTVALSAGTTTWQVARRLRGGTVGELTFVTNSLNVAGALEANGWHSIVVSGGSFRTPSDALVGPFANQTLRQLNTDLLLLGVHSLDARVGLTTPNIAEAETNRVMVAGARRVVVVADSSKLGQVSLATFAGCDEVDEVITDSGADRATLDALAAAGLRLQLVDPEPLGRTARVAAS